MNRQAELPPMTVSRARVYCPICTHNVDAEIVEVGRRLYIRPGQKCARCGASLDAASILRIDRAA